VQTSETFGQRLRRLRAARGISCSELAYRVGVTEGAIRQIETGQTKNPSFVIGLRIADVLQVDPWELAVGWRSSSSEHDRSPEERIAMLEHRMGNVERRLDQKVPADAASPVT
jgi:transcriptional regulator with XRE-family HTH domain